MSMLTSRAHRDPGTRTRRFAISLPILAAATLCTAWAEIFWGGVVRLSKSGLGCADNWPLLLSRTTPPQKISAQAVQRVTTARTGKGMAKRRVFVSRGEREVSVLIRTPAGSGHAATECDGERAPACGECPWASLRDQQIAWLVWVGHRRPTGP